MERTLKDLSTQPCVLIAHNAKFELGWMRRHGIPLQNFLPFDTMLAEYVLAGNRPWPLDLDSIAQKYRLGSKGRLIDRLMKGGVCPSEMPEQLLAQRCESDVSLTTQLFYLQRELLEQAGLTRVVYTRCVTTPVLTIMESEGMLLDHAAVAAEYDSLIQRRAHLQTALTALAAGVNLRSGKQMGEFLYTTLGFREMKDRHGNPLRTATGRPRTDSLALSSLTATTDSQKHFLKLKQEHSKIDSALTKTLDFFYRVCEERGATFRAQFHQSRTRTHRLSSSGRRLGFSDGSERGVQFQNLPRAYKRLFVARNGNLIVEADGAQLEFRVGGSLAHDPQILRDVQEGADVHRFTASVLHRIPEDQVTKRQRDGAKADTFKPMYGGMSGTPRQKAYYEAFRQKYHSLHSTQQGWTMSVLRDGCLRTASGLTFYWPGTRMDQSGYVQNSSSIFNYPIQSLATAEIIPISLVYLFWLAAAETPSVRFVNTVHDSVVAEVPAKELDKYRALVVESFLNRTYEFMDKVYGIDLYVPLGVSIRAGTRWGEGEEVVTSDPYRGGSSEDAT